jgi:hypothetical protein
MKKDHARCDLSSQNWERFEHAACDLEFTDCEENRFCHETVRRRKQQRNEICH